MVSCPHPSPTAPDTVELAWPLTLPSPRAVGTERGCVVLDQPQHAASSRRLRTSHALRLVFDTAALRSNGARRGIRGHASSTRCENPCTGSGVLCSLFIFFNPKR